MRPIDQLLADARELGRTTADAAASWTVTDYPTAKLLLSRIAEGDPRAEELMPVQPSLSGEWADEMTPHLLLEAVLLPGEMPEQVSMEDREAICTAWEAGVDARFQAAVEEHVKNIVTNHEESH